MEEEHIEAAPLVAEDDSVIPNSVEEPQPSGESPEDELIPASVASLADRWAKIKSEVVGERGSDRLVDMIDTLVPEIGRLNEFVEQAHERELKHLGQQLADSALKAVKDIRSAFGVEVNGHELLGQIENGGMQAYARLHNLRPEEVVLTPDVMTDIFELRNAKHLRGLREQTRPLPDLHRGGGARESASASEDEEILSDIRSARAAAGMR